MSAAIGLVVLLLGAGGATYWYLEGGDDALDFTVASPVEDVASSPPAPQELEEPPPEPFLPDPLPETETEPEPISEPPPAASLDESDDPFRQEVDSAATHPLAAQVLRRSDLIRTLVTSTVEVAEGRTPRKRFDYLEPKAPFEVRGNLTYLRAEPQSYTRYDTLVDAFSALDTTALMLAYERFEPLFDEAYAELGYPGEDFDDMVEAAVDVLLQVPVLSKEPALIPRAKTYAFEDPALEGLSSAQRQLLRMGPRNVRRAQQKLQELKSLLRARRQ